MAATDHKLAFIGLGVMGAGMASRLAESGYDVTVYNRTRSKAEEVAEVGATVADSPADAAREADVVMMSLADQNVVEKIVFGDDGVASSLAGGSYLVDMSTVPPAMPASWQSGARQRVTRRSTPACSERPSTPDPASSG